MNPRRILYLARLVEIEYEVGEITNDCILAITDYADDGDTESLKDIWDENVQMLHQNTGI